MTFPIALLHILKICKWKVQV